MPDPAATLVMLKALRTARVEGLNSDSLPFALSSRGLRRLARSTARRFSEVSKAGPKDTGAPASARRVPSSTRPGRLPLDCAPTVLWGLLTTCLDATLPLATRCDPPVPASAASALLLGPWNRDRGGLCVAVTAPEELDSTVTAEDDVMMCTSTPSRAAAGAA